MVGSDPDKFSGLADQMKMPETRQRTCKRDFAKTSEGWQTVLKPWLREPGDPETKIDVVYGDGKGMYDGVANMFRSRSDSWRPWPRIPPRTTSGLTRSP
jgi:hypothetical protein